MTDNKKQKSGFFMVDNRIFSCGLKARDIAVYCCICKHINSETKVAFPSRRTIAAECGIAKPETVDKALNVLLDKGLIEKQHRQSDDGGYQSNTYRITDLWGGSQ